MQLFISYFLIVFVLIYTGATRHTKHAGTTVAADATEEEIIAAIKEFLRQAIGRAKT